MENGTMVYRFFYPFNVEVHNGTFKVAIYDSTFYCDILYREGNPISISGSDTATCEIVQNSDVEIPY